MCLLPLCGSIRPDVQLKLGAGRLRRDVCILSVDRKTASGEHEGKRMEDTDIYYPVKFCSVRSACLWVCSSKVSEDSEPQLVHPGSASVCWDTTAALCPKQDDICAASYHCCHFLSKSPTAWNHRSRQTGPHPGLIRELDPEPTDKHWWLHGPKSGRMFELNYSLRRPSSYYHR